jgi:hypothetical protein
MFAIGRTPPEVMDAMGHTTAGLTLAFYAKAMRADDQDRDRLRTLVEGHTIGTRAQIAAEETLAAARV